MHQPLGCEMPSFAREVSRNVEIFRGNYEKADLTIFSNSNPVFIGNIWRRKTFKRLLRHLAENTRKINQNFDKFYFP